jgi:hypothetical protein
MTTYQSDLKLYRFANQKPHPEFSPYKYEYQLFKNGRFVGVEYSDQEFQRAVVTVDPVKTRMELVNSTQEIDTCDLEDINTFVIEVTEAN